MFSTIIIFIAVLSLLVFVHELGHFVAAKKAGVRVDEFGFGFPPRLFGIKKGDTVYSINWIPLGGFVKIKGETGEHRRDKDSFSGKPAWQRAIILAAGVIMNFALAWFLLTVGYMIGLPQVAEDLPESARVADPKIHIISVLEDSPADRAGIEAGDAFASVDGAPVMAVEDFRAYVGSRQGRAVRVTVRRGGELFDKEVTPEPLKETGAIGIGVALVRTGLVSYPWFLAPVQGANAVISFTREVFSAFYGLLAGFVTTRKVTVEFSGPVGIAVLTGEVAKRGFRYLLQFTALLSVNLAVINIFPFPALDGGRLFFLAIERVRRRAMSRTLETFAHNIGFALLMFLVLVITYRDVVRFGEPIWKALRGIFGA